MRKFVWLLFMFDFKVELISVVADQSNIGRVKIIVDRNSKQDKIFAPSSATALLKNLDCRNLTSAGGKKPDSLELQCSCQRNETFIAHNRTCVKNGILVKNNNCTQIMFDKHFGTNKRERKNTFIMMMDNLLRYININNKNCRPSTTVTNKYLNCKGDWENFSPPVELTTQEMEFSFWLKIVTKMKKELQGRLIKVALECKDDLEVHQECVLLKAYKNQTCQFLLPSTAVTANPRKSNTVHYSRDLNVDKPAPTMPPSEVHTTVIKHPKTKSRSEKENGNPNSNNATTIVIGVVLGVCSLVIVVACFFFIKRLRDKKEVSSSNTRNVNNGNDSLELHNDQQECCYEEPSTTIAEKTPRNASRAVDHYEQIASQSVVDYQSISNVQDTEYLSPVVKPEVSISDYYSPVEVIKDSKKTPNSFNQQENKVSVSHNQNIQEENSISTKLETQHEGPFTSTSLVMEESAAPADMPLNPNAIYSKPDKRKKQNKTNSKVPVVEKLNKTPVETDDKEYDDVSATNIVPKKPLPYSSTHKKNSVKAKESEEDDVNVKYEAYNELVTLAKPPRTEFHVYDEAEKVLTEKESRVLNDNPEVNDDPTDLDTLQNTSRRHTLLSASLSRNGDFGARSGYSDLYDEPEKIISAEGERKDH